MAARIHTVCPKSLKNNLKALQLYETKIASEKANNNESSKKELFEEDKNVYLQIDFITIPKLKNKSYFLETERSPIFDRETSEVCLITKDDKKFQKKHEQAKYDQKNEQTRMFKNVCNFTIDVLPFNVIKSDFKTFEQKRILCNSYDFFVADRDVFDKLPSLLGSYFIKNKKMPRKVNNLHESNEFVSKIIEKKLSEAVWQVDGRGTCSSIVVGKNSWALEDLVKNAEKILEGVAEKVPRGWNFVKSVHVKMEGSIALEIFNKDGDKEVAEEDLRRFSKKFQSLRM